MKLAVKNNEFSTNSEKHGNFRVANNAAMQKILSDSLYQDKIKSVIREISCNALDAHTDAGVTRKFKVTLPTYLEPIFAVRDYGKGLSLQELEDLYTVYGISTKRNDNNAVGAFGLGSKSPFSYTKMWTVISRHNGMKYIACNSVNGHGSFCYDVLHQEETDEENGLEVRFDVEKNDIVAFQQKAESVYSYFPEIPEVNIPLKVEQPKYVEEGPKYKIVSFNKDYYRKNNVVVGPVAYPIELEHFKGNAKTILDNCGIDLYVDIGDVEINPGRESLGYGSETIRVLSEILESVYVKLKEKADKEVATCKTLWEARIFANTYFNGGNYIGRILNYTMNFDGQVITNNGSMAPFVTDPKTGHRVRLDVNEYKYDNWAKAVVERKRNVNFNIDKNTRFCLYEQGAYAGARRYTDANQDITLYVIKDDCVEFVTKTLGYPESDFLKVSSFPAAVRQTRAKSVGTKVQAYRFDHNNKYSYYNGTAKNFWDSQQIDLDAEKGYYALIKDFHINSSVHCRHIEGQVAGLNIIGILESRKEKVIAHANWTNISEYFKDKVDKLAKDPDVVKYSKVSTYNDTLGSLLPIYNKLKYKNGGLAIALKNIDEYKKSAKKVEEFKAMKALYEQISGETYVVPKATAINLDYELTDYPLLKFINKYHYTEKVVIDYINQVDKEL